MRNFVPQQDIDKKYFKNWKQTMFVDVKGKRIAESC